jgi:hypothetical protein
MFFAEAELKLTAPSTLSMTWLLSEELIEFDFEAVVAMLAAVLVEEFSELLLLWVVEEFFADCSAFALELLVLNACCEALFALCEFAL